MANEKMEIFRSNLILAFLLGVKIVFCYANGILAI